MEQTATTQCYDDMSAENAVLAIMFTCCTPQNLSYIFNHCDKDFFRDTLNHKIFKAAHSLYKSGEDVNNVSVWMELEQNKLIGERIFNLATNTFALSQHLPSYCKSLFKGFISDSIKNAKTTADYERIKDFQDKYGVEDVKVCSIAAGVENFEENYNKRLETQIQTGYSSLDSIVGSFCGGDYIALGGTTGTGKTTTALNIAKMICAQGRKVLFCSLEMTLEQLQNRFVCLTCGLNADKMRSGSLTPEEKEAYKQGLETLKEWDLSVLVDYYMTIDRLKSYATDLKNKKGLDFIIIDYLGLVKGSENKSSYERMSALSRNVKTLATELNIPILVLVQLNRDLKGRQDKRPILSDIRESGAIEQDADFVLFAHRPSMFDFDEPKEKLNIIVAKNRHGSLCAEGIELKFNLKTQEITEKPSWAY